MHVVVGVGRLQTVVHRVVHDGGGQKLTKSVTLPSVCHPEGERQGYYKRYVLYNHVTPAANYDKTLVTLSNKVNKVFFQLKFHIFFTVTSSR